MASLESASITLAGAGVGAATRALYGLANAQAALVDWARARETRRQLSRLTDRELDDIGLTRSDIARRF